MMKVIKVMVTHDVGLTDRMTILKMIMVKVMWMKEIRMSVMVTVVL